MTRTRGDASRSDGQMYQPYRGPAADTVYAGLKAYMLQSRCRNFIVSSECFYEWLDPAVLAQILSVLDIRVSVVVNLRRQDRWLESVYSQVVRDQALRYSGVLEEMPQFALADYRREIGKWVAAFGQQNFLVDFYREQAGQDELVERFLARLDFAELAGEVSFEKKRVNASLDADCTRVLAKINADKELSQPVCAAVLETLEQLGMQFREEGIFSPWRLSDEQSDQIMRRYQQGNRELMEILGVDPGDHWGQLQVIKKNEPYRDQKREAIRTALKARMLLDDEMLERCVS